MQQNNASIKYVCNLLLHNDNFAVYTHENPDADTIGSCFALVYALRLIGKKAYPVCCEKIPKSLAFMTRDEKYFSEDDLPDGFKPKFFISTDVATPGQLGIYKERAKQMNLVLDHHLTHESYAKVKIVDPKSAACAEIVYRIVSRLLNKNIPWNIASLLYTAIAADTGGFRYSNTSPSTYTIAAKLIEYGANNVDICRNLFDCKTQGALAAETFAMENVKYLKNGTVAYVKITLEDKQKYDFEEEDTYDVINTIRKANGVKLAIFVREKNPGIYKISTRSMCGIDVSKLCGIYGGGGHAAAAGCTVSSDIVDSAVERIMSEVKDFE